jgi:hypothetical protein
MFSAGMQHYDHGQTQNLLRSEKPIGRKLQDRQTAHWESIRITVCAFTHHSSLAAATPL